jgi:hypothetical protein
MVTTTVTTRSHGHSMQLQEGFQLDANEVYLKRVGRSVLLIPKDADQWEVMAESLEQSLVISCKTALSQPINS